MKSVAYRLQVLVAAAATGLAAWSVPAQAIGIVSRSCAPLGAQESVSVDWRLRPHRLWTTSSHYRKGVLLHTVSTGWHTGWRSYAGHLRTEYWYGTVIGSHYAASWGVIRFLGHSYAVNCNLDEWGEVMLRPLLFVAAGTLLAGNALAQGAAAANATSPVPQLEPGKPNLVSLAELPADVRQVAASDFRNAAVASGELFADLPEEEAAGRRNYQRRAMDLAALRGKLKAPLADIAGSALAGYRFEGVIPEGPSPAGPWSSFIRLFRRPDGVMLTLEEWDFAADGGGILAVREFMNASVNGRPAQFLVRRSPSGDVVSELKWFTSTKALGLSVSDVVGSGTGKRYDLGWLVGLAEGIR